MNKIFMVFWDRRTKTNWCVYCWAYWAREQKKKKKRKTL